jgi:hypothetical protein
LLVRDSLVSISSMAGRPEPPETLKPKIAAHNSNKILRSLAATTSGFILTMQVC